jgi:hypothetical protein
VIVRPSKGLCILVQFSHGLNPKRLEPFLGYLELIVFTKEYLTI